MTEFQIERLAEDILEAHGVVNLPVDPLLLAREEGIRPVAGNYDSCFDARIEYRPRRDGGRFYLFYTEASEERPLPRVRFSVAHELGHFFLSDHRRYLSSGKWRGRHQPFLSARRLEREANWFAAALLMPRRVFTEHVLATRKRDRGTLRHLRRLAEEVFQTSVLATALRYCQLNFHPCCVVVWDSERVRFSVASDSMRAHGYWAPHCLPDASRTRVGRRPWITTTESWFEGVSITKLREEACELAYRDQVLTHISLFSESLVPPRVGCE